MRQNVRSRGSGFLKPGFSLRIFLLGALFCASLVTAEQAAAQEAGNPASAVAKKRLTMDEAVDLAIKNNLSLESGRVALDTKQRASKLVWNQFLPDLSVSGTLNRGNEGSTVSGNKAIEEMPLNSLIGLPSGTPNIYGVVPYSVDVSPQWIFAGNFSASLNLSAALGAGIQTIRRNYQAGVLTYEKAKIQTERDVRKAYYQILLLQENAALLQESVVSAQRQVDMAQANYRASLASQLTLLQAQVSRANMQPNIDQMESGLKMAQANFAMSLGLPYDTEFELVPVEGEPGDIPLDVADLIFKASRNKPDILELRANILTMQSQRTAQVLQQRTPYLRLGWTWQPTFAKDLFDKDTWDKDDWTKDWMDRGAFSITLGWSINSVLPFAKEWQGVKDLDNNIKTASIGLTQTIRGTELEVYNTVLSLGRIRSTWEAQNRTVDLAQQSYRSTEQAYQAGQQDFLQVQNAQLELSRARVGVLEQYFNYLNGLIDLEYAIGVPFGTLSRSAE